MHVKAKQMAFGGLLLAVTVVCMALGSVIETNTLFLLAAAAFFVGIVIREFGLRTGVAFYLAAVLLGFLVTPNKFYVITFAAMGFYIWGIEAVWIFLAKRPQMGHRMGIYWFAKYVIFNLVYLPCLFGFRSMLFQKAVSDQILLVVIIVGQVQYWFMIRLISMFREAYGKNGENVFYKECMGKSCRDDRIFLYIKGMSHISVTQGGKSL